jgi:N-acetylmuramic acid 6-phosphate (MurNAc-6-P) etherase
VYSISSSENFIGNCYTSCNFISGKSIVTQKDQQVKIIWFVARTGCSQEEARKWLVEAKWRMEIAIQNRRFTKE